jgi:hypothetical protein
MDEETLAFVNLKLAQIRVYMEYGAGGSTVLACTFPNVQYVLSVETDQVWKNYVLESLATMTKEVSKKLFIDYLDLGEVGDWGTPRTTTYFSSFNEYPFLPWRRAKTLGVEPEFILIDGRFRLASFLICALHAKSDTPILFDDYFDRPHYHICEEFGRVEHRFGRAALFYIDQRPDIFRLIEHFGRSISDWR